MSHINPHQLSHCSVPTKFDEATAKIINAVVARFQDMSFIPKIPSDQRLKSAVSDWFTTDDEFDMLWELLLDSGKLHKFYSLVPDEQRKLVLNLLKDEGVILK